MSLFHSGFVSTCNDHFFQSFQERKCSQILKDTQETMMCGSRLFENITVENRNNGHTSFPEERVDLLLISEH